jgi:hypothetical protein
MSYAPVQNGPLTHRHYYFSLLYTVNTTCFNYSNFLNYLTDKIIAEVDDVLTTLLILGHETMQGVWLAVYDLV